jgi:F-type H+-transporting ATPase subunit gamma
MQLDKQIQSIKTTQKITLAMRLIAMSLYVRIEKLHVASKTYQLKYNELLALLTAENPTWKNPITHVTDPFDRRPLIILISSIKGLCGGFNNNIFSYFDRFIEVSQYQTPLFITIGKRATDYIENFIKKTAQGEIILSHHEISSYSIDRIINDLVRLILNPTTHYSSILIYSTKFENFFVQRPIRTSIVDPYEIQKQRKDPRQCDEETDENSETNAHIIWEQPSNEILKILSYSYLHAQITPLIINSLVAEQSARFLAMEHATSNAEKYIEKLQLTYNKLRQESITKELAEITSLMGKSNQ